MILALMHSPCPNKNLHRRIIKEVEFCVLPARTSSARLLAKQIYANTSKRIDCPSRVLVLLSVVQLAKEVFDELRVSILYDGLSCLFHQIELVVHIVHSQEMRAGSLLCSDVVDVGSCDSQSAFRFWSTAGAFAAFLDWAEVFREIGVAKVEHTAGSDGVAEAL